MGDEGKVTLASLGSYCGPVHKPGSPKPPCDRGSGAGMVPGEGGVAGFLSPRSRDAAKSQKALSTVDHFLHHSSSISAGHLVTAPSDLTVGAGMW